ncbi:MAG: PQQ-binding-like beta-propeller repeat protein [Bifidobacteriaceae bacterium]|jgi:outer membrane protein assembly factor BamB|nr:PQQ-binding-like beta-propeller repeat protein [Bifidobacteriaceae bacterium]
MPDQPQSDPGREGAAAARTPSRPDGARTPARSPGRAAANPSAGTGIASKIPRAKVMPSGEAAARAAAAAHAAAALRGAAAAREEAAHEPADQEFRPRVSPQPGAELPRRRRPEPRADRSRQTPEPDGGDGPGYLARPQLGLPLAELPEEFMPSARPRNPVAMSPPARPSLGSVPLGPIKLDQAGSARPGRRSRRLVVLALGLAVVVALGAGGLWLLGRSEGGLAPDLEAQPTLGRPVNDAAVIGEGIEQAIFRPALDRSAAGAPVMLGKRTVLVEATGPGQSSLVAMDARDRSVEWRLDLAELMGDASAWVEYAYADGGGGLVVGVGCGVECVAKSGMVLSLAPGSGEILGQRPDVVALAASDGLVALADGDEVAVASVRDLAKDKWRAAAKADDIPRLVDGEGAFWVWTDQGFADAASGELVGFGADATDPGVDYQLFAGGVLIRSDWADGAGQARLKRIDPATGDSLWAETLNHFGTSRAERSGDWIFTTGDGEVTCADLKTGHQRWTVAGDRLVGTVGATAVVAGAAGQISAVEAANGAAEYQFQIEDGEPAPGLALGAKTLYRLGETSLTAYPLAQDAAARWQLELPGAGGTAVQRLFVGDGGLWLMSGTDLRAIG